MMKISLRSPLNRLKKRRVAITALSAAGFLLAAAACGSDDAAPSRGVVAAPTPDAQATITALARTSGVGTPTPTAVPAADRAVAVAFAEGHGALVQQWDSFHSEFDGYRLGLTQCTPGAVRSALSVFAGNFGQITESTRALPRPAVVRNLADDLIKAAEQEEAALRLLRDTWQPGATNDSSAAIEIEGNNPEETEESNSPSTSGTVGTPFENVAEARSRAALLRRSVADSLFDRTSRTDEDAQAEIDAFAILFRDLETAWDQFHRDYDDLRTQVADLSASDAATSLSAIVAQFADIVSAVRDLPDADATRSITQTLSEAAQEEDRSLRKLRGAVQDGGGSEAPSDSGEEEAGETDTGMDTSVFGDFDSQIATTNDSRGEARRSLAEVKRDISPEAKNEVANFTEEYDTLTQDWNSFHNEYDQWRKTDGGCNRSEVMRELGRLGASFSEIAREARNLPAATVLRPMGELLVEAADREERAYRDLGDTWEPYDASVYATVDQERDTANKIRRQVTVGLQELFERFGISP